MGQDVDRTTFSRRDRQNYRAKVQRCLDALAVMLKEHTFARDEPMTGLEVELNLVDHDLAPSASGAAVLESMGASEFQSELGQWNLELNLPPRPLPGDHWRRLERQLLDELATVRASALEHGAQLAVIGILPTLEHRHLVAELLSPDSRYTMLNEQMLSARGEPIRLDIAGDDPSGRHDVAPEHLVADFDSIAPEAACTSMQLHLQVPPDSFAAYWNAAQCVAGVQLAVGANSPFLLGSRLWAETRIPLFEQSCDVRTPELRNQGVRPRVWFGERWITSVLDLFAENTRYFPALMPVAEDNDPFAELESGIAPGLDELRLHNGTIWRWNRPVYDIADGVPHLRVENRVLPAGPTVVDMVANALFFYGLLRELVEADRPLWSSMSFEAAEENFTTAARHGLDGPLYWPGNGWIRPDELVLRKLLPQAAAGLARWGVTTEVADRYLGVIERRCVERRTGASWQLDTVAALEARGADRPAALRGMLARYLESSAANEPVHDWPVPA
ncbi:glutamate-cysteine ligase family protein [Pseudonocardia petroleophila]|uniref:Glutamate--cysteine ligase n=1 Tax=Pseudonocardia petroleophila TaxID=37331 RepID=A0A7G7MKT6_9PSEU|nr:glutamate--cysteine ligase [Pseudonocardia petroleophila]QNG53397.1 glutamate--cysteine ligase [Pseudonocardia petroleophila]